MILIIGGAYQGKLDAAKELYGVSDIDCHNCSDGIDWSKKVLYNFEKYVFDLISRDINPMQYVMDNIIKFHDKIVIITDISSGVVPMDKMIRKWREDAGRVGVILSKEADKVVRVFCGIPTKLR